MSYTTPLDSVVISADSTPVVFAQASAQAFCLGDTAIIIASGAAYYSWAPNTVVAVTPNSDTVAAVVNASTQYIVTGVSISGCTATASVNVPLSNPPNTNITAAPNDTICAGDTLVLNSIGAGGGFGNTYLWSTGSTTRRDTLLPTVSGNYSVTITNQFGCSKSDTISITVLPALVPGFTVAQNGLSVTITNTAQNATTYVYSFGDGSTNANVAPSYNYTVGGTYTITQVVSGVCGIDSISKVVNVAPEGIAQNNSVALNIYPNPVLNGLFTINNQADKNINIYTADGQLVFAQALKANSFNTINIQSLANNVYFVRLGNKVARITKQ
jgi:hypothetical protein